MKNRAITLEEAKRQYVHRYTMEHKPAWAEKPMKEYLQGAGYSQTLVTVYYAPQYATDKEWYERTSFPGEGDVMADEDYCYSHSQTWPLGRELNKPFTTAAYEAPHA